MKIEEYFSGHNSYALGFSGGVDSACLLYLGTKYGADITPYFVYSTFQTEKELHEAESFCKMLGIHLNVIKTDVLTIPEIVRNNDDRCYYCKKHLFSEIIRVCGDKTDIEGTNLSDDVDDRPGYKALCELGVESPLRICGYTKEAIRETLRNAGYEMWSKPSKACLATRIVGQKITYELLNKAEIAENALENLGFSDFRVRIIGNTAKIQVKENQLQLVIDRKNEIINTIKPLFDGVLLDLEAR